MKFQNWAFSTTPLFLIGMPFSGKSAFGKLLSSKTGKPCIDLDKKIEESEGRSIEAIFDTSGEEYFRGIESKTLRNLDLSKAPIVTCGGGTPCFLENMDYMEDKGVVIYLYCPMSELVQRALLADNRPLLKNVHPDNASEILEEMLKKRELFYSRADIILKNHTKEGRLKELGLTPRSDEQ
jgi:shikimate kinase